MGISSSWLKSHTPRRYLHGSRFLRRLCLASEEHGGVTMRRYVGSRAYAEDVARHVAVRAGSVVEEEEAALG